MNRVLMACALALLLAGCGESPNGVASGSPAAGHAEEQETEAVRGPHGGQLLVDGDFTVELAIHEAGTEPQYRAWAWKGEAAINPRDWHLKVELLRLGGATDSFAFSPVEDYLQGDDVVGEPHSFEVTVEAESGGAKHRWRYDSFEGRTTIGAEAARASEIGVEKAGPQRINETLELHGMVVPDPQRVFRIRPRFAGVIKSLPVSIGDRVAAGDVLATIEANESLRMYTLRAPHAGVIVSRTANVGESVGEPSGEESLLTLIDLDVVWVELAAFQHDLDRLKVGQEAIIRDADGHRGATGKIVNLSAVGSPASQSMTARISLPNESGLWRPGLFVSGEVTVAESEAPLAVKRTALQTFRDWTVVYEKVGEVYEVRPVTLGRTDAVWAEVLDGLKPGADYVAANSFVVKADIEKSGASHDH